MTNAQQLGNSPVVGRGTAKTLAPARATVVSGNEAGSDLSALYINLALLGVAALASAAASSLFAGLGGGPEQVASHYVGGIATSLYGMAALVYSFTSMRKGILWRLAAVRLVVSLAAAVHLAGLLLGLWRLPESSRTFDLTLATLLALELSVIAVLGWRSNAATRRQSASKEHSKPSAMAVVGTMFAASLLVAALTTVGMAASKAGELAIPHSGHGDTHNSPAIPGNIEQLKNQDHHH